MDTMMAIQQRENMKIDPKSARGDNRRMLLQK